VRARRGFVVVWVVAVIAAFALTLLALVPARSAGGALGPHRLGERRVAELAFAAQEAWLRDGGYPASLAALTSQELAPSTELAGQDPFDLAGAGVDYALAGADLALSSRGPDHALGTSDDRIASAFGQTPGRSLSRNRLRVLRALYTTSAYVDDPGVTPPRRAQLLQALRDATVARRHVVYASGAQKAQLQNDVAANEATVSAILAAAGAPAPPASATGPGGLLEAMGLPDPLGVDGFGTTLYVGVPGFLSAGVDTLEGGDDDL
jgi:hypothetical protein